MRRKCLPENHPDIGKSIGYVGGSYVKLEMFSEALTMVEEYMSWKILPGSSSALDDDIEVMRKEATEGLARQRKITKLKEKEAAKKGKVVKVTAEMVAESERHEAELLKMFGDESIAATSRGSVGTSKGNAEGKGKKAAKKKKKPKMKGKKRR